MHIEKSRFKVLDPKRTTTHTYYFQSWYSPVFIEKRDEDEDGNNSVCITFDARKESFKEPKKKDAKSFILLANIFRPTMLDSHDVLLHAKNLCNDFTNNTLLTLPPAYEQQDIIVPSEHNVNNHFAMQLGYDNLPISRFFAEDNGEVLENMLHYAIKLLRNDKFYLAHNPKNQNSLRSVDSDFLNMIVSYPNSEAYSLVYAWVQGLIYADRYLGLFDDLPKKDKNPFNHGYGVER